MTDVVRWAVAVLVSAGFGLGVLAVFLPWGAFGMQPHASLDIYSWGAKGHAFGDSDSLSWFSDEALEASRNGAISARLGFLGLLAGLLFAGFAALAAPFDPKGHGTAAFGIGGVVVGAAGIVLLMNGIKEILFEGVDMGIQWSGGFVLAWVAFGAVLAGSVASAYPREGSAPQRHDYQVGMRVGTERGEGVIVGVDRYVYVLLDGKSEAWRFEPKAVNLIIRGSAGPAAVRQASGGADRGL